MANHDDETFTDEELNQWEAVERKMLNDIGNVVRAAFAAHPKLGKGLAFSCIRAGVLHGSACLAAAFGLVVDDISMHAFRPFLAEVAPRILEPQEQQFTDDLVDRLNACALAIRVLQARDERGETLQ